MEEKDKTTAVIAGNVRRLRLERDFSQNEVAEKAGLSRNAYVNLEAGKSETRVSALLKVAVVLGVRLEELFQPPRRLKAVRFRAHKRMMTRDAILNDVSRWIADYVQLEELLNAKRPFPLKTLQKSFSNAEQGVQRAREAAARVRSRLGLQPDEPIRDICGLLEDNGIKLFTTEVKAEGFFGLSLGEADGGPAVVVNTEERIPVERQIFTAVHELAHLILHFGAYDPNEVDENETEEKEANVFAGDFLMPPKVFEREWQEAGGLPFVKRVLKVKRMFHVSYKTVLYRVSELDDGGKAVWQRFQSEYKALYGKTLRFDEEPYSLAGDVFSYGAPARLEPMKLEPADFFADRLSRLVRQGLEKGVISRSRGAEILGMSVSGLREMLDSWAANLPTRSRAHGTGDTG